MTQFDHYGGDAEAIDWPGNAKLNDTPATPPANQLKPKIPPVRIPSDDCAVMVGQIIQDKQIVHPGTPHYVHVGEWIEVLPITTVLEVAALSKLQAMNVSDDTTGLDKSFSELCHELAQRVISWSWTDMMGQPLAQPYNRPDVIATRTVDEVLYLVSVTSGQESRDERKNGFEPSANISSSATAPSLPNPS